MFGFLFLGQMEDFKINKKIRSGDKRVDSYIEGLEDYLLSLEANGTNRLIMKLEEVSGTISKDLDKILAGDDGDWVKDGEEEAKWVSNLTILNDSNTSKTFDRVLTLYSKIGDIRAVSEAVKALVPEEVKEDSEKDSKLEGNVFEAIQRKVTGKR